MTRSTSLPAARRGARCALWGVVAAAVVLLAPACALGAIAQDRAADTGGALDVAEAALEQRDVGMFLRVTTAGAWTHADLARTRGGRCA